MLGHGADDAACICKTPSVQVTSYTGLDTETALIFGLARSIRPISAYSAPYTLVERGLRGSCQ